MSQRLSLSLGLRWEVNPAPGVTQGLKPYTFKGPAPIHGRWHRRAHRSGRRLGSTLRLAWAPPTFFIMHRAGKQLCVAGVAFSLTLVSRRDPEAFSGPGFVASGVFPFGSFPTVGQGLSRHRESACAAVSESVYGFAPHLQLPYTLQWNASIEQALGKSQALTVSYRWFARGRDCCRKMHLPQLTTRTTFLFTSSKTV